MMKLFKIFYKNKTFFFSLFMICYFFLTEPCVANQTDVSATIYHTKNDPFLFAFSPENFTANIQNSLIKSIYFEWTFFPAMIIAALAGYAFGKRKSKKQVKVIEYQDNSDARLLKKDDYDQLIEKEKPFIQKYDMVTVLFADIEGFTEITDNLEPETLLEELNSFFFYFDIIIDHYRIEKIKTMGDAYMCAGGIPLKNHTNPVDVVMVALDVQNHLKRLSEQNPNVWSIRIGVHTGQVVAGMLGHTKLSYDIWGHTVNVASRLETSCKAGKVHISGTTFEKIERFFDCEYHGALPNTKEISYFVTGLKPGFVERNADGLLVPNHAFFVQMQLLRLADLEDYVKSMMTSTNSDLCYHNFKHVLDVYEQVELLAHSENMKDEDILLLKTAALLHDIGYSISYHDDMLQLSENIARESLPIFQYKQQQIEKVCRLMKATHYESVPDGIMEKIMHDANMMHFGRADYISRLMCLFREQEKHGISIKKTVWLQHQISHLTNHQFHTMAANELVKVSSEQQIANLTEAKLQHF